LIVIAVASHRCGRGCCFEQELLEDTHWNFAASSQVAKKAKHEVKSPDRFTATEMRWRLSGRPNNTTIVQASQSR